MATERESSGQDLQISWVDQFVVGSKDGVPSMQEIPAKQGTTAGAAS